MAWAWHHLYCFLEMLKDFKNLGKMRYLILIQLFLEVNCVPLFPNEAVVGTTPMTEFETLVKAEVVTGLAFTTSRSFRVGGGAVPKIDK